MKRGLRDDDVEKLHSRKTDRHDHADQHDRCAPDVRWLCRLGARQLPHASPWRHHGHRADDQLPQHRCIDIRRPPRRSGSVERTCIKTIGDRRGHLHNPRTLVQDGFYEGTDRFELVYGIRLDHERVGTVYIAVDTSDRNNRLVQYAEIAATIISISLLTAFILAAWLQRALSGPIVDLARIAGLVSEHKDYS